MLETINRNRRTTLSNALAAQRAARLERIDRRAYDRQLLTAHLVQWMQRYDTACASRAVSA